MGSIQAEGAEHSTAVIDSIKFKCDVCQGTRFQVSKLGDDPDDIAAATVWAALGLTNAKGQTASIGLCHCGHLQVLEVVLFDVQDNDGGTGPVLTDLDSSVINSLAGWWYVVLIGTDAYKYVRIASNSIATPTVLVLDFATNADGNGVGYITNVEPAGLTKIVA